MRSPVLALTLGGIFCLCGSLACSAADGPSDSGVSGGSTGTGGSIGTGASAATGGSNSAAGGTGTGTGGGTGGGSSSGGSTTVLFSEDFEAASVGDVASPWKTSLPTMYDSMGIVEVTTAKAHGGTKSVYVKKGTDNQAFLQLDGAPVFPWTGGGIYVRAYFLVPTWPSDHASWMEVGATANEASEFRFGAHQGVLQINHYPGDQDQTAVGQSLTPNEWHCYEYFYDPDAKKIRVWVEGNEITGLAADGGVARGMITGAWPAIAALRFGAEIIATEAWFDDIAVSKSPIGCL